MSAHLYLAPAGGGKTTYLVARAHALSAGAAATVRVVVPTRLQVRAWQRRLAEGGGALGVRVGTFEALYRQILREAGRITLRLSDPVQYRLLRLLIDRAELAHYRPLRAAPGFVRVVLDLIGELKAGKVFEDKLTEAVQGMGNEARLRELADLYAAYQARLQEKGWADAAGIGWLAQEALRDRPQVASDWPCVVVDGFDDLTSVQLDVLGELSRREGELLIALTGTLQGPPRSQVHKRFNETRRRIESALGLSAELLPERSGLTKASPLAHLEATLYVPGLPGLAVPVQRESPRSASPRLRLIAAADREGEVRAALRWLKERSIHEGVPPSEMALLARTMNSYRPYVLQVAAEYGLPVQVIGGLPLRNNPVVAALMDLLRLPAPSGGQADGRETAYPWRQTVEAWRTPYFTWSEVGLSDQDADALAWVARWGSVVGGLAQWRETFALLQEALAGGRPEALDEDMPPVSEVLDAESARALGSRFERFVARITPPPGAHSCRAFVRWIEGLIGDEAPPGGDPIGDLGVMRAVLDGPPELVERDRAALVAFKDILRGPVWAEEALECAPAAFGPLLEDLQGAVNTATYRLPLPADEEAVVVADVTQARGVSYRAVAVLGLAEGEFPTALVEDPFLRDADRRQLKERFGLQVELTTEGAETAYFYEAITRSREWLLLTRPRIADNGAPWQASPFWDEVRRRVDVEPVERTGSSQPTLLEAASWPELMRAIGARTHGAGAEAERLWAWALKQDANRGAALGTAALETAALEGASEILRQRAGAEVPGSHDGDLVQWKATFAQHFGADHTWSASRLESYRTCPLFFFVGSALGLAPRAEPSEGLDARQLGNLYHRIMEAIYVAVDDPTDLKRLLETLPQVADPILDGAPRREQFRPTAWWEQTRARILEDVRDSLQALDKLRGTYVPHAFELAFGLRGEPGAPLVVPEPEGKDTFRLHGLIDRVDRAPDGRLRIIDYKTGGHSTYAKQAFLEGKKLQLPLYALAAQEALGLGEVADGYYWHVRQAGWHLENERRTAWISLAKMGVADAIGTALRCVWETLRSVREGRFVPRAPEDGCPDYCPAASFCWHYDQKGW